MKKLLNNFVTKASALLLVSIASAHAVVDVSAATTTLTTEGGAAITLVGQAMLTLAGIAIAFKWAKAAFFG